MSNSVDGHDINSSIWIKFPTISKNTNIKHRYVIRISLVLSMVKHISKMTKNTKTHLQNTLNATHTNTSDDIHYITHINNH